MNKVILFIWFGDEKPPYTQWTLENFRKMNPGWEIRYVEYSNAQLSDYTNQNDPVLCAAKPDKCFSYWVDDYKWKYLSMHKDEFIIYCDLDCFPIAPFDNFICTPEKHLPSFIQDIYCKNFHKVTIHGTCAGGFKRIQFCKHDLWCMSNNDMMLFSRFLQLHKGSVMDDTLTFKSGILINTNKTHELEKRSKNFHKMKIELGDNFCLPQFTPIEHYYSFERNKLNKGMMS